MENQYENLEELKEKLEENKNNQAKFEQIMEKRREIGKVSESKLERILTCNDFIQIKKSKNGISKVHRTNNCEDRFCPICAKKKSLKLTAEVFPIIKWIYEKHDKRFIFVTLSSPNVKKEELNDTIKLYNTAFDRLKRYPEWKNLKGYIRKLEITYNEQRDDYNPHFHVIFAVNKTYFTDSRQYIKQERWLEMWRKATRLGEKIKVIDVRRIKDKESNDLLKGALEVAKYSAKSQDYLKSDEIFDVFSRVLKGKRLFVYGGLFKEGKQKLVKGELDCYKEKDINIYLFLYNLSFNRDDKVYDLKESQINSLNELFKQFKELNDREPTEEEKDTLKAYFLEKHQVKIEDLTKNKK